MKTLLPASLRRNGLAGWSLALLLAGAGPALPAAPAPAAHGKTAAAKADPLDRTKARINTLLKDRLNPAPLPDDIANPFTLPGRAVETPEPVQPVTPTTKADDTEILAHLIPLLKIGGFVQVGSVPRVIINQAPYKEGDVLVVRNADGVTYLRVKHIDADNLTLELNKAEQTIKL